MAVRAGDATGEQTLPGGLSFTDDLDDDDQPPARRGLRTAVWLVVLGLLLGGGGAWGARWVGESDIRSVLASSTATYSTMLERLRQAPNAAALAAVAGGAPRAAARIDGDLAELSGGGGRRAAVAGQVAAERDVLLAVGALAPLEQAPLQVWGDAHAALSAAVDREASARASLRVVDAAAAGRLPDTAATVRGLASTVGEAVVDDVARAAGDLVTELDAAQRTADLRAVAERSAAQLEVVAAAAQGLGGSPDGAVLTAFAEALLAVGDLRALTPADPSSWPPVRGRLQSSLQVVAEADAGLASGSVRARLPLVLQAVDRLVDRAVAAQAAWQTEFDAAVAAQAADAAALREHGLRVREAVAGWVAVRPAVEALVPEGPPEQLDAAFIQTERVRQLLAGTAVPPGAVEAPFAGLRAAVEAVSQPLRSAYDASWFLPYSPPVAEVAAAQAALPGYDPALAAWEAALAAAEAEVAARALPPPPDA